MVCAMRQWRALGNLVVLGVVLWSAAAPAGAQQAPLSAPPPSGTQPPAASAPVTRLGDNLFRVGNVRVDLKKREISVPGKVNEAQVLEFIATTQGGFKSYESALELETNAVNFNTALILIGLDKANAVVPRQHFDPIPPAGDPVEIWVEWDATGGPRRVKAEQLVYNAETRQTLAEGPWVYTGSTFMAGTNAYMAEMDGTLIGFVHTPSPIIENPAPLTAGPFGANRLNPSLQLTPGTRVVLTVRALPLAKPRPE